jgi:hypothetical protein
MLTMFLFADRTMVITCDQLLSRPPVTRQWRSGGRLISAIRLIIDQEISACGLATYLHLDGIVLLVRRLSQTTQSNERP